MKLHLNGIGSKEQNSLLAGFTFGFYCDWTFVCVNWSWTILSSLWGLLEWISKSSLLTCWAPPSWCLSRRQWAIGNTLIDIHPSLPMTRFLISPHQRWLLLGKTTFYMFKIDLTQLFKTCRWFVCSQYIQHNRNRQSRSHTSQLWNSRVQPKSSFILRHFLQI